MRRSSWVGLALSISACVGGGSNPIVASDGGADAAVDAGPEGPRDGGPDAFAAVDAGPLPGPLPPCDVTPPDALLVRPGPQEDGSFIPLDGRRAVAAGPSTVLEGFPTDVAVHPTLRVAYVLIGSNDDRRLDVVDLDSFEVLQEIEREVFFGLEVAADGARVYLAGGESGLVLAYDVGADGTLTEAGTLDVEEYLAGLALSPDGATLWAGAFDERVVVEIDTATLSERRRFELPVRVWDLVHLPAREELWASDLRGEGVAIVNLRTGAALPEAIPVPTSPAGMAVAPDASVVWAAVSGSDSVVALDPETRSIVATVLVGAPETDLLDDAGAPLPHSNVNALWYDAPSDRLYVSRGADNAVSVLAGTTLEPLGTLPSDRYPTDVELAPDGRTLVVVSGKGGGEGPNAEGGSAKNLSKGTIAFVDLLGLDLEAATEDAARGFRRPAELWQPDCEAFPVPTELGRPTPIRHVVLIVKENKTFDTILGDLEQEGIDADPSLADDGLPYTPNHHALALEFAHSDNFYVLAPNSDTGHLFLTATHLTELAERTYLEDVRHGAFGTYPVQELSSPRGGNFFTHLHDHGVSLRIFGEIVGTSKRAADGTVMAEFSDSRFPGGPFTNYTITDEEKARYVADRILRDGELAQFTYLLLPNDHGNGTRPGTPSPESMVADNDYAMGLVIDALSRSTFWPHTVVFVLEDDPQGSRDHVHASRSVLHVVSPWARRGFVSHAHSHYLSVFATIERILGVPPLGRPEATAAPLYDMFGTTPDFTPYEAREREFPPTLNGETTIGADLSRRMDFRGPDRNPHLGELVRIYRAVRRGELSREAGERRMAALEARIERELPEALDADGRLDEGGRDRDEAFDEAGRERDVDGAFDESLEDAREFDRDWAHYQRWYRARFGREPPFALTGAPEPR
ncbi:MAG TPA: alkaline phosphatase family protein [Polyangiaceae bacterium LLY-WYZ-15_(1-7)]|nr:alkaline phosphatase family protein [Polyangiaceae bacterium LLY-WYZ-15_(1-7)]